MATVSGQGTTYNLPNYTGELFAAAPAETPFLSAIGGLNGGLSTTSTEFEWQTVGMESTSINNVAVEGADPSASEVSRENVSNVVEIHQEAVEVTYSKLSAVGKLSGIGDEGTNPVRDELDFQVRQKLRKMAVDVELSFLAGVYQNPSNNTTARQTRGILSAISTNVDAPGTTRALTAGVVNSAMSTFYQNGGLQNQDTTVFIVDPVVKTWLSKVFGTTVPRSRTVGGVNIETIVTDFGEFGVMLDRWMPSAGTADRQILVADLSVCEPVFLEVPNKGHFFAEPLAKTGSSETYQVYGEVGLKYGPEVYHGVIKDLKAPA